jgi:hypothetical protein
MEKLQKGAETEPSLSLVAAAMSGRPSSTGKKTSTKDTTSNGVTTSGDLQTAGADKGGKQAERFIAAAVKFIAAWKAVSP